MMYCTRISSQPSWKFFIVVSICVNGIVPATPHNWIVLLSSMCLLQWVCLYLSFSVLSSLSFPVCRRHLALHLLQLFCSRCFPVSSAYIFTTNHKKRRLQPPNHPPTSWQTTHCGCLAEQRVNVTQTEQRQDNDEEKAPVVCRLAKLAGGIYICPLQRENLA